MVGVAGGPTESAEAGHVQSVTSADRPIWPSPCRRAAPQTTGVGRCGLAPWSNTTVELKRQRRENVIFVGIWNYLNHVQLKPKFI